MTMGINRRSAATIGLVLLALSSGCLGFLAGDSGSNNTTDEYVPGEYTDTPNAEASTTPDQREGTPAPNQNTTSGENITVPAGISADSVNERILADQHASIIRDKKSFTAKYTRTRSGAARNTTKTIVVSVNLTSGNSLWVEKGPETNRTFFKKNGTVYARIKEGGSTTYTTVETPPQFEQYITGQQIYSVLRTGQFSPADAVKQDGPDLIQLQSASPTDAFTVDITAYGGTAVVDSIGVVRKAAYSIEWEQGDETLTQRTELEYFLLGNTSVNPPDWIDNFE